jgi:hypothetical protein
MTDRPSTPNDRRVALLTALSCQQILEKAKQLSQKVRRQLLSYELPRQERSRRA